MGTSVSPCRKAHGDEQRPQPPAAAAAAVGRHHGVHGRHQKAQQEHRVPEAMGLHSSTFQLNLGRFGHTPPSPPV